MRQVVGGTGFNPHWSRSTPLLVPVKFGLGVGFDHPRKVKNPNSSLNQRYEIEENVFMSINRQEYCESVTDDVLFPAFDCK